MLNCKYSLNIADERVSLIKYADKNIREREY